MSIWIAVYFHFVNTPLCRFRGGLKKIADFTEKSVYLGVRGQSRKTTFFSAFDLRRESFFPNFHSCWYGGICCWIADLCESIDSLISQFVFSSAVLLYWTSGAKEFILESNGRLLLTSLCVFYVENLFLIVFWSCEKIVQLICWWRYFLLHSTLINSRKCNDQFCGFWFVWLTIEEVDFTVPWNQFKYWEGFMIIFQVAKYTQIFFFLTIICMSIHQEKIYGAGHNLSNFTPCLRIHEGCQQTFYSSIQA